MESNRQNALVSTGPKTPAGKRRSAANSLRHGLRSPAPVIPGEDSAAWQKHRDGIVLSLAPANTLESELAERVALLLWRLRRLAAHEWLTVGGAVADTVADVRHPAVEPLADERRSLARCREALPRWEAALNWLGELPHLDETTAVPENIAETVVEFVLNAAMDRNDQAGAGEDLAEEDLAEEDLEAILRGDADPDEDDLPTPDEGGLPTAAEVAEAAGSPGADWAVAQLCRGIAFVAGKVGTPVEALFAAARRELAEHIHARKEWVRSSETALLRKGQQVEAQTAARLGRNLLPESADLLMRYETHLNRQLSQTLQALEQLQAARQGRQPPPSQT
jgi:hypothetical protein